MFERPFRGYEYNQLLRFMAAETILLEKQLDGRMTELDGMRAMDGIREELKAEIVAITSTMPAEQLIALKKSIPQLRFKVGVAVPPQRVFDRQVGQFLSNHQINTLVTAAREKCIGCLCDRHEASLCLLRRTFDALDFAPGTGNFSLECPYRGI